MEIIEEKAENERREQEEFLETVRAQIYEDQLSELEGVTEIARLLQRKIVGKYILGINAITGKGGDSNVGNGSQKTFLARNFALELTHLLSTKLKENKEFAYKNIVKQFGSTASVAEKINSDLKFKGKMLMGLKEYPRLNLKRAFWRWYLVSTGTGENLFQRAADNLVLYTNINKTTSFYRLFNKVKGRKRKVHPRVKRMTVMLYLYSKLFLERNMREFMERLKLQGGSVKVRAAEKLIDCAKRRRN